MAKVVVVGGGYGGITVAGGLDDFADVVLIEQKDRFVHHAAALRAAVDPVWRDAIFMPYSRLLQRGKVVHGTAMRVEGTTVHVTGHEPITGDYLVLATGTTYPYPAKHMVSQAYVAKLRLEQTQNSLADARRVLLVGAGTVGVEFAGELTSAFPHLEITMVDKADTILGTEGYLPQLRESISQQLQERGVHLVLGSPLAYSPPVDVGVLSPFQVSTAAGVNIEADIWFLCHGSRTASGYLNAAYGDVLHPNGRIKVNKYLQVEGTERVFAVGDITDVPESKRADAARAHARVVIANIRNLMTGEPMATSYLPGKEWVILPLGPDSGASQLVDQNGETKIVGPRETAEIKGTDLMVSLIRNQLRLP
ncbi:MAG: FAD/NAD(P)-binding oxidoreductase [Actinomycetaceae bacterium]|nr:FAD/NAD(P)-binding oxidoreductase [Actinomycetaceae bacterium]